MNLKRIPLLLTVTFLAAGLSAQAADFVSAVRKDTEALTQSPSRLIGSKGHEAAKEMIAKRIEALPGVKLVRQPFPLIVPKTERAVMDVAEGTLKGEHPVYPVWPDNVRLKSTPKEGISGKAVYIRDGKYESLPGKSLRGGIAVMEMSSYSEGRWLRAFDFGAKAVILLGSKGDTNSLPHHRRQK